MRLLPAFCNRRPLHVIAGESFCATAAIALLLPLPPLNLEMFSQTPCPINALWVPCEVVFLLVFNFWFQHILIFQWNCQLTIRTTVFMSNPVQIWKANVLAPTMKTAGSCHCFKESNERKAKKQEPIYMQCKINHTTISLKNYKLSNY